MKWVYLEWNEWEWLLLFVNTIFVIIIIIVIFIIIIVVIVTYWFASNLFVFGFTFFCFVFDFGFICFSLVYLFLQVTSFAARASVPLYEYSVFANILLAALTLIFLLLLSWNKRHCEPRLRCQNWQSAAPPAIVPSKESLISIT